MYEVRQYIRTLNTLSIVATPTAAEEGGGGDGPTSFQWIEPTGTLQSFSITFANSGTVSSTITVPDDATYVLVGVAGFRSEVNYFSGGSMTFTQGGSQVAMTSLTPNGDSELHMMGVMFGLASPDTGTNKTLTWDWQNDAGMPTDTLITVRFFKGVNTSSAIRDSDAAQSTSTSVTSPTLTMQTSTALGWDLIVAMGFGFADSSEGSVTAWSNLTLLDQVARLSNGNDCAWATGNSASSTTVGITTVSNWIEVGIAAAVLKPGVWPHPDNNNVGLTGAVTSSGTTGSSSNGQTIENLAVSGLVITHDNVTVRNCRITMNGSPIAGIWVDNRVGCLIENCEIIVNTLNPNIGPKCIWLDSGSGHTVRACDISGGEDGIYATGTDHIIVGNYIHDLVSTNADPHHDGIQLDVSDTLVEGNNVDLGGGTNISAGMTTGDVHGLTVNNNRVTGGVYCLRFEIATTDTTICSNNRLDDWGSGAITVEDADVTLSNNVDDLTGVAV